MNMDELYGLHSTLNYSMQQTTENIMAGATWTNYDQHISSSSSAVVTSSNRADGGDHPVYGSGQFGSGSSGISDAASMVAELQRNNNHNYNTTSEEEVSSAIRAKIASHPLYPKLLEAYIDCQKVGATPEMAGVLDEIRREGGANKRSDDVSGCFGADPELDEFMETYCDTLIKYKSDFSKPFDEATTFLNSMEAQLSNLCNGVSRSYGSVRETATMIT